ncbi:MAG: hypothetical protein EOP34_05990 [Rickettsiales bacterium]|nr:MAG: hypothetical protein EOP34_05990 [Rickettsiales bacterium]
MLLILLLLVPLIGTVLVSADTNNISHTGPNASAKRIKLIGLNTSLVNLFLSIIIFLLFNFSSNNYQFVQEYHSINSIDFYLGVDGISIYFVLLTTIIMPIAILSN